MELHCPAGHYCLNALFMWNTLAYYVDVKSFKIPPYLKLLHKIKRNNNNFGFFHVGGVENDHLFIQMDYVLTGWVGLVVIMLLLNSIEKETNGLLLPGKRFIHCWPWLHLSTVAQLSMYRKFFTPIDPLVPMKGSVWRFSWNDLWNSLWTSLLYAAHGSSIIPLYKVLE